MSSKPTGQPEQSATPTGAIVSNDAAQDVSEEQPIVQESGRSARDRSDYIARTVGLTASLLLMIWAVCYLSFGRIAFATASEIQAFYAFLLLFSGPITYYWVASTTDNATIDTPLGKFVIGGGFAVALAIVIIVHFLPQPTHDAWCLRTFIWDDDTVSERNVKIKPITGNAWYIQDGPTPGMAVQIDEHDAFTKVQVKWDDRFRVERKSEIQFGRNDKSKDRINLDQIASP